MNIETAARRADRRPASPRTAERQPGARGMPYGVVFFLISLMLPIIVYLGPLRLSPHRLYLLIVFLPLLIRLVSRRAGRVAATDILIATSTLWAMLAIFVSAPGPAAIEPGGIHLVEFFGAYLVGRVAVRSAREWRAFVRAYFVILLVLLPFAAIECFLDFPILLEVIPFSYGAIDYGRWGLRRAQTVFAHPILYGTFVSVGLGFCWYALRPRSGLLTRGSIGATIFFATFMSLSAGAIVSFVIQAACISWDLLFRRVIRQHWKILVWCAALSYVALDLASNRTPFHLLVDYATFSSSTGYYRIVIWRWGIDNVWANPVFGLGLNIGEWERAGWMHGSVDNFWLLITMQYGLPTFLGLALGIFLMVYRASKAALVDPEDIACRTGYLISLAGLIIAGGTVHYWHAMMAFFMFMVGAGMWMTTGGAAEASRETEASTGLREGVAETSNRSGNHHPRNSAPGLK